MSRTTEQPRRPRTKAEPAVADENERIVRERLKTFDHDKQDASDWADVKARILQHKPQP